MTHSTQANQESPEKKKIRESALSIKSSTTTKNSNYIIVIIMLQIWKLCLQLAVLKQNNLPMWQSNIKAAKLATSKNIKTKLPSLHLSHLSWPTDIEEHSNIGMDSTDSMQYWSLLWRVHGFVRFRNRHHFMADWQVCVLRGVVDRSLKFGQRFFKQ